jgi:hypothetical protein
MTRRAGALALGSLSQPPWPVHLLRAALPSAQLRFW